MRRPWAVLLDFDGTLTVSDLSDALLLEFGGLSEKEVLSSYHPGVSTERWMREKFRLVRGPLKDLRDFILKRAKPRPGAVGFLRWCLETGIPVEVVSGGIDLYLDPLLRRWGFPGLKRFRAKATRATAGLRLDYRYLRGATLAEFKRSRVLHHRRRGRRVLFAGDGTSDLPAAQAADLAFARGHLLRRCRSRGVPARPLDTFAAPRKALSCSPR
ncbi:MAG TPA: hypothetical protein DCM05_11300 [Elusimicrobia bacterium]|nr:hypothetical protein [Elusimicrobiota bacterium]